MTDGSIWVMTGCDSLPSVASGGQTTVWMYVDVDMLHFVHVNIRWSNTD